MRYRLNEPDVIQETVDGETLIVNTRSGVYYNFDGSGTRVWSGVLAGRSTEQIADLFECGADAQRAVIRSGVEEFIGALLTEQLITPAAEGTAHPTDVPGALSVPKLPFTTPELRKYTDMQELLLVDPIHEVNPEAGWPLPKDPSASS